MELESHGDADGLSGLHGAAFGCWRAVDAVLRHDQVLHSGHLGHSSSAGAGHPGLAGLQMLHTEKQHIHPARYWWVGIRLPNSTAHFDDACCPAKKVITECKLLPAANNDLLYSDEKSRTAENYSGAPSTRVRWNRFNWIFFSFFLWPYVISSGVTLLYQVAQSSKQDPYYAILAMSRFLNKYRLKVKSSLRKISILTRILILLCLREESC